MHIYKLGKSPLENYLDFVNCLIEIDRQTATVMS